MYITYISVSKCTPLAVTAPMGIWRVWYLDQLWQMNRQNCDAWLASCLTCTKTLLWVLLITYWHMWLWVSICLCVYDLICRGYLDLICFEIPHKLRDRPLMIWGGRRKMKTNYFACMGLSRKRKEFQENLYMYKLQRCFASFWGNGGGRDIHSEKKNFFKSPADHSPR